MTKARERPRGTSFRDMPRRALKSLSPVLLRPMEPSDLDGAADTTEGPHLSARRISAEDARSIQSASLAVLSFLGIAGFLWMTQTITAPILIAFIVGIVLSPLSDFWDRVGVRHSLSALFTVLSVMLLMALLVLVFEPYVSMAIDQAPMIWAELSGSIDAAQRMFLGAEEIARDVADVVDPGTTAPVAPAGASAVPTVREALFLAPQVASAFLIFAGTLYFFVMTREEIYEWAARAIGALDGSDFQRAERQVARYLLTISAINASFGILVAIAMQGIGMTVPIFWGLAAFMLNFVLYLGPIFLGLTLIVAGHVAFDGAMSFVPAILYLGMNAVEGQFVTPALVGQRMAVNPLVIFLSLVFWMWLWGPIGAIVAIPVLIWILSIRDSSLYRQAQIEEEQHE